MPLTLKNPITPSLKSLKIIHTPSEKELSVEQLPQIKEEIKTLEEQLSHLAAEVQILQIEENYIKSRYFHLEEPEKLLNDNAAKIIPKALRISSTQEELTQKQNLLLSIEKKIGKEEAPIEVELASNEKVYEELQDSINSLTIRLAELILEEKELKNIFKTIDAVRKKGSDERKGWEECIRKNFFDKYIVEQALEVNQRKIRLLEVQKEYECDLNLKYLGTMDLAEWGLPYFAKVLRNSKEVKTLCLSRADNLGKYNGGMQSKIDVIIDALIDNTSITTVDYGGMQSKFDIIIDALTDNTSITTVDFSYCNLYPSKILGIANALKNNVLLKELYLGNNRIGAQGAIAIKGLMSNNDIKIEKLDLTCSQLEGGMLEIINSLNYNESLLELNLSCNIFIEAAGEALVKTLQERGLQGKLALSTLDMGGTGFYDGSTVRKLLEVLPYTNIQEFLGKIYSVSDELNHSLVKAAKNNKERIAGLGFKKALVIKKEDIITQDGDPSVATEVCVEASGDIAEEGVSDVLL